MLTIRELTTGYLIPKMKNFRYFKLENHFTVKNVHTQERDPYGIIEDENFYRIPKINEEDLCRLINVDFTVEKLPPTPNTNLSVNMIMKNPPKDKIQEEVINNVVNSYRNGESRVIVSLPTGQGKTYVATNIISKLNTPTFIFVKSVTLRDQWYESFMKHSNLRQIAIVTGSADLFKLLEGDYKYDVIVSTHSSVQSFIKTVGMRDFNKLLIKHGIGCKVYDEFDLENDSMWKVDTHTNTKYNLYLSATDYKSHHQNKVFQSIFGWIPNYGKEYGIKPDRNALFVVYNSKPTRQEFGRCHRYTATGSTFDYHKYHEYIVKKGSYVPGLTRVWNNIIKDRFYNKQDYLKTVFFIGRKVTAEDFRNSISELFGVDKKYISILNSDTPDKDKEDAKKSKLIISTSDSLGRGVDLNGLDVVVDLETRASLSKTTQVVGRVSRSGMKNVGTYICFVDTAFPTVLRNYQHKINIDFYDDMFTSIKIMELKG